MTALLRHPIPAAYRRPRVQALDPRFRRALAFASAPAVLLLLLVALVPQRRVEPIKVEQLPERFAKLILEEKPAPPPPAADRAKAGKAAPDEVAEKTPPVQAKPRPIPRVRRDPTPRVAPDRGEEGRTRAKRDVVAQVAKVTSTLDESLSKITSSLDQSSSATEDRPQRRRGRSARRGRGRAATVAGRQTTSHASVGSGATVSVAAIDLGGVTGVEGGVGVGAAAGGAASGASDTSMRLGERSQSSLLQTVRRYAPGIRYCYDHALKSSPALQGKMAFRLRIEADGSVSDVEVIEDTLRREEVRDCALTQIREWKFAPAASQTVFETPFVFRPRR